MSNRTVRTNDIPVGTQIFVRGRVVYSHIRSLIEGDELNDYNDRKRRNGNGYGIKQNPFVRIVVEDATTLYGNPAAYTDPNLRSPGEVWADESLYISTTTQKRCFEAISNGGKFLPWIGEHADANSVQALPDSAIEGELAKGLLVILVMNVYKSKFQNNGVGLTGVICEEPIQYFAGARNTDLSAIGLTFKPATSAEPAENPIPTATAPTAQPSTGYTAPAATANPYTTGPFPTAAQPAQQPYQAPAAAPAQQPVAQPAPQTTVPPQYPPAGAPMAAPQNNVGINFVPGADGSRQY